MTGLMLSSFWERAIYDLAYTKLIKYTRHYPKMLDGICRDIHATSLREDIWLSY